MVHTIWNIFFTLAIPLKVTLAGGFIGILSGDCCGVYANKHYNNHISLRKAVSI